MRDYAESTEQATFFRGTSLVRGPEGYPGHVRDYCWAIPNAGISGGRRALIAGVRRKAEGVTSGIPDIECAIPVQPYTGWHCEMKRKDGVPSDVTEAQREKMKMLVACGRKCVVGYGADDALKKICDYLGIKP